MKMYGSYSDEDLNDWQKFPQVASVLTSSSFGAWLMRRDENKAKQFPMVSLDKVKEAREEFISKYPKNYMGEPELGGRTCYFSLNEVLEILDKLIESEEK